MTKTRGTPAHPTPTTLTARTPEDVLALVPVVLGFVPHDSVVMLTFGAERTFHARLDLPHDAADLSDVVSVLLDPALRHRVRRVVFVLYSADELLAHQVARSLGESFARAGIEVIETLRADGDRWFPLARKRSDVPDRGVAYDVTAHRFMAQSVLEGQVTHRSRSELAGTLASDAGAVAAVMTAVGARPGAGEPDEPGESGEPGEAGLDQLAEDLVWVRSLVSRHIEEDTSPDDEEAARLLLGMQSLIVRDLAWSHMTRDNSRDHVRLWTDLVRRAPTHLLAAPAALLGFAAWLAGHGALAWCAIDRCRESDDDYRLAGYLAQALTDAVPPSVWDEEWSLDDLA